MAAAASMVIETRQRPRTRSLALPNRQVNSRTVASTAARGLRPEASKVAIRCLRRATVSWAVEK